MSEKTETVCDLCTKMRLKYGRMGINEEDVIAAHNRVAKAVMESEGN